MTDTTAIITTRTSDGIATAADAAANATKTTATTAATDTAKVGSDDHVEPSLPTTPIVAANSDTSLLLLDRLRHNATIYPKKRAMAFVTSSSQSSSSSSYKVKIEREITFAELEYETDRLALSLLEEHQITNGDRYVRLILAVLLRYSVQCMSRTISHHPSSMNLFVYHQCDNPYDHHHQSCTSVRTILEFYHCIHCVFESQYHCRSGVSTKSYAS